MSNGCESYRVAESKRSEEFGWQMSRRGLLATVGLGAAGWLGAKSALAQVVVSEDAKDHEGDILISVFLRGGMDGLSAVVPYAEDAYHRGRPNLRLRSPKDNSAGAAYKALDLDGFFGLNPGLAALLPLYKEGKMAVVHAVGSGDQTRSHFEAMNAMERGMHQIRGGVQTGWVARHLASTPRRNPTPLRAVALSSVMPDALRGASHATTMASLTDFRLADPGLKEMLTGLYGNGNDVMAQAGRETLQVLDKLSHIKMENKPAGYPGSGLGIALQQVATLIRSGVGLEVACLEMGGWDTHVAQGTISGWLPGYLKELGDALAAFEKDMGPEMRRITLIVQTEFGRRVNENTGLGTDHGRASAMFLLGGSVRGGRVFADWPGMEEKQLDEVGDLRVTTDYRDVLADALTQRVAGSRPAEVFPGWEPKRSGGYFSPLS
ncbi:MAG: DUF1501 domain-containing protein [Chlorobia bacterium]|nr:DUF1501 domain-containing protein [Fimbriimonadaceae bacterium]